MREILSTLPVPLGNDLIPEFPATLWTRDIRDDRHWRVIHFRRPIRGVSSWQMHETYPRYFRRRRHTHEARLWAEIAQNTERLFESALTCRDSFCDWQPSCNGRDSWDTITREISISNISTSHCVLCRIFALGDCATFNRHSRRSWNANFIVTTRKQRKQHRIIVSSQGRTKRLSGARCRFRYTQA